MVYTRVDAAPHIPRGHGSGRDRCVPDLRTGLDPRPSTAMTRASKQVARRRATSSASGSPTAFVSTSTWPTRPRSPASRSSSPSTAWVRRDISGQVAAPHVRADQLRPRRAARLARIQHAVGRRSSSSSSATGRSPSTSTGPSGSGNPTWRSCRWPTSRRRSPTFATDWLVPGAELGTWGGETTCPRRKNSPPRWSRQVHEWRQPALADGGRAPPARRGNSSHRSRASPAPRT